MRCLFKWQLALMGNCYLLLSIRNDAKGKHHHVLSILIYLELVLFGDFMNSLMHRELMRTR